MTALPRALQIALFVLALAAGAYDLRFRRIPNWLTASGFCLGLALHGWLEGWPGLQQAILGAGLGLAVYFVLFALRAMGGGDVKLMAAVGAIVGPLNWLVIFLAASLLGGLIAIILVLSRGTLLRTLWNVLSVLGHLIRGRAPYRADPKFDVSHANAVTLPHGVCIALACFLFLFLTGLQGG